MQDAAIAADREAGLGWNEVALRHGVSRRTALRRAKAHRDRGADVVNAEPVGADLRALAADDGRPELARAVDHLTRAVQRLDLIAATCPADQVAIVANVRLVDVVLRRLQLLQAAGVLPRQLAGPSIAEELQQVFRDFSDLLRRHEVPEDALRDFLALGETTPNHDQAVPA